MKHLTMIVMGAAVAGSLTYTVKLRREVRALSARMTAQSEVDEGTGAPTMLPQLRSVPEFVAAAPGNDPALPAPLPEVIASDADRDLLRGFVRAELARVKHEKEEAKRIRKEEKRQKRAVQNEKDQAEFHNRLAKELALPEAESRRLGDTLAEAERTRRSLREAERAGQTTAADTATALGAMRTKMQSELKTILGDNWSTKLQQVDRRLKENRQRDKESRSDANGPFWFASNPPARP